MSFITSCTSARRGLQPRCNTLQAFLMRPANTIFYMVRFRFHRNGCLNLSLPYGPAYQRYHSKSSFESSACLIIECKVPILISLCMGTGTDIVEFSVCFCMITWLPFCLTFINPCLDNIRHTSLPDKVFI